MRTTTMLVVAALAACAWAADDAAIGPSPMASRQSPIASRQSFDAITIPQMLSYQGKLTDTLGVPVADTTYSTNFRLYNVPSGGSPFWNETQVVRTRGGLFSVLLGSTAPIGSVPDAGALYLGMAVAGGNEMTPRLHIVSAAYAYLTARAANSDLLQGKDTTALDARYVNEAQANSVTSGMIVNATIAAADLSQMGAAPGQVMKWTGSAWAAGNDSVGDGATDSAWVRSGSDSVLYTIRQLGIARGQAGNKLWGNQAFTHVNLGVACTTGYSGENYGYCTVGGGLHNEALGPYGTVAGGTDNEATGVYAAIGGGQSNTANYGYSTVSGGQDNWATGTGCAVSGGASNEANNYYSTVGGGYGNTTAQSYSTISGGYNNAASRSYSTVGGGSADTAKSDYSGVLSGYSNLAGDAVADTAATVCGGWNNAATGRFAFAGGGYGNAAQAGFTTVAGGRNNSASGQDATVGGGWTNSASGMYSSVVGGTTNNASGDGASVSGGNHNLAAGSYATVSGGLDDSVRALFGAIGGGYGNVAGDASDDTATVVCGGDSNRATGKFDFIGGGYRNNASNSFSVITGGHGNTASGPQASVGGGWGNTASGYHSVIAGGLDNVASGTASAVSGGEDNAESGYWSTIAGGRYDTCAADYAVLAGYNVRARAAADYTLAFGENCSTSVPRAVVFYHSGAATKMGVGVQTPTHNIDVQGGAYCNGTNWVNYSSRKSKTDISALTSEQMKAVLAELDRTQVVTYRYKSEPSGERHIGLIAEDAPELLATPDRDGINTADAIGFLLALAKVQQAEIEALKVELRRR